MASNDSIISNSSYTNKDFQSIYPALLDLVKKITYRWDPSISNESDPGVILLKLNAIIADKCNYNIDKNILECFPLSVTQERNARQLFEQLGYYMHWYIAAKGEISLRWSADKPEDTDAYTIPKFTTVADDENSTVYTLIEEKPLPLDGSFNSFTALQGVPVQYSINGETLITPQNLDSDNRLYLEDMNVAENGIFIRNASVLNWDDWTRKDNLAVETVSSVAKNYKFGVTLDTNVCYIEFPVNAQEIIGEGIYITYIKTDGYRGNVAPFVISKFYNDVVVNNDVMLNSSNVQIYNPSAIANGEDTESIDSAYKGYKKVVGTFNTLVTLRDYINSIIQCPIVSNGFVTDRVSDIDSQVNMVKVVNGIDQLTSVPLQTSSGTEWYPFDLKFTMLYAKDDYSDIQSDEQFNDSFKLLSQKDLETTPHTHYADDALAYISDKKSVQQNLNNFTTTVKIDGAVHYLYENSICFIKNYYPVSGIIIPQYKLTQTQVEDIQANIKSALHNNLNARELEFGQEVDYDLVYDVILQSDERIKSIILNDLTYETYAVYFNGDEFIEVRIDEIDENHSELSEQLRNEILVRNILAGKTPFYVVDNAYPSQALNQDNLTVVKDVTGMELTGTLSTVTTTEPNTKILNVDKNTVCRFYAPNLIVTNEYTSYVKYEYRLSQEIPANANYQLSGNEYVAFYWSNDDDSGYQYAVYGAGHIIKPSFVMESGTNPTSGLPGVLWNLLNDSDDKYINGTTHELMSVEYSSSSTVYDHIQGLTNADNVLSSKKTICIEVKNEVALDSPYFCTWILNTATDGYYVLFDEPTADEIAAGIQTRILNSGEYFIYTNESKSSLIILGQGTQLSREVSGASAWTTVWECVTYDYSEIVDSGLETLVNKPNALVSVPEDKILTVTEMQFISVAEGGQIKLVGSAATPSTPEINSITDIDNSYSEVGYASKNDVNQGVGFTNLQLDYYNGDTLGWKLYCAGVIDISPNKKFTLVNDQKLILNVNNSTEELTNPIIITNSDIYGEGHVETDSIVVDNYSIAEDGAGIVRGSDGTNISVTFDSETTYNLKEVEITCPDSVIDEATYLLTADASNLDPISNVIFNIYVGESQTAIPVYAGYTKTIMFTIDDVLGVGSETIKVEVLEDGATPASGSFTLSLRDLKRCVIAEGIDKTSVDTTIAALKARALTDEDFNFDYTYEVDEDDLISNPLEPVSFWSYNHEYNKFTIAQMDTESLDGIFITNKIR